MPDELYDHICAELAEDNGDGVVLLADGLEDALIGVAEVWIGHNRRRLALYDLTSCLEILTADGTPVDEAAEYLEVAVTSAYLGEGTPVYAVVYRAPMLAEPAG